MSSVRTPEGRLRGREWAVTEDKEGLASPSAGIVCGVSNITKSHKKKLFLICTTGG
jgi:hypothetical protein